MCPWSSSDFTWNCRNESIRVYVRMYVWMCVCVCVCVCVYSGSRSRSPADSAWRGLLSMSDMLVGPKQS